MERKEERNSLFQLLDGGIGVSEECVDGPG